MHEAKFHVVATQQHSESFRFGSISNPHVKEAQPVEQNVKLTVEREHEPSPLGELSHVQRLESHFILLPGQAEGGKPSTTVT